MNTAEISLRRDIECLDVAKKEEIFLKKGFMDIFCRKSCGYDPAGAQEIFY